MREMKDSGIEWIGSIPKEWKVGKVKDVFIRKNEKAKQENPVVLSLARSGVKIRDITKGEGQLAENYSNYNPVEKGDFLLNPMDLYSGANCSTSEVNGVISPAYINLRAKEDNNSKYYDYYFKTQYWAMALFAHGKGVSFENRWTLGVDAVMNYYIPIPKGSVQDKISKFLDKKITEIDNVIEKTKETIEDYKLYKQTIISKVVTKGINKNCKMKKSGVMWIGNIPEHWKLSKFKYKTDIIMGQSPNGNEIKTEGIIPFMQGNKEFGSKYPSPTIYCETCNKFCRIGDILMSVRAPVGAINEADKVYGIGRGLCSIKVNDEYVKDFVKYYLIKSVNDLKYYSNGSVFEAITTEILNNFYLLEIPLTEQRDIVKYLDNRCDEIDDLISNKEKLITELESYKKSIIYEYVTGKKEVI